jgi:flagellar hook-associated protein 3 FlgL
MRTTFVSTASLLNTPRTGIARMQSDLVRLNNEVISGRMSDVGLSLGANTGRSLTLHIDTQALASLVASNGTVTTRLEQTQSALDTMLTGANDFLKQIITNKDAAAAPGAIKQLAQSALSGFISNANASDGHDYLFGGINSATPPLADYGSGPGAAVSAAFQAAFGMAPDDPAVASISGADMSAFLDTAFSDLFADPAWGTTWSSASSQVMANRIAPGETIDSSVSANEPAMRKLAMIYSMVASLGVDKLGADARQAVLDKASSVVGDAVSDLTSLQAGIGTTQNRVKDATDRLTAQQAIIERRIGVLEGVDPAEAKIKIDTLSTQIEMSYSLTAKLLQMSILNYV